MTRLNLVLSEAEVTKLFEQLVAIQKRMDGPEAQSNPTFDVVGLYAAQAAITHQLRTQGGLSQNEITIRFAKELAHATATTHLTSES
jgi:hypothetical protein